MLYSSLAQNYFMGESERLLASGTEFSGIYILQVNILQCQQNLNAA